MWYHALCHHYAKINGDFPEPRWTMDDAIRYGRLLLIDGDIHSVRQMGKKGRKWLNAEVMRRIDIVEMTDEDYALWKSSVQQEVNAVVAVAICGESSPFEETA